MGISPREQLCLSPSLSLSVGVVPGPSAAWPVDYCLLMFQSAVCWGMWSYLTWTSPGVPRRRSVWAPPPSPALGTKLSHKHNHTLATPGLQLCASHRREMGKTLHQGDRINLITNRLAKAMLTPTVPGESKKLLIYTITYWNTIFKWMFYGMKQTFISFTSLFLPNNPLYIVLSLSLDLWKHVTCHYCDYFKVKVYFKHSVGQDLQTRRFNMRLPFVMWYGNDP